MAAGQPINTASQLALAELDVMNITDDLSRMELDLNNMIQGSNTVRADELRTQVAALKASLAAARNEVRFWQQEINDEKAARKNQNQVAQG